MSGKYEAQWKMYAEVKCEVSVVRILASRRLYSDVERRSRKLERNEMGLDATHIVHGDLPIFI